MLKCNDNHNIIVSDIKTEINKKPIYVDTVHDLAHIPAEDRVFPCIVKDKDRGGVFIYDPDSGENDGGIIFYNWVRQCSSELNILWWGADKNNASAIFNNAFSSIKNMLYIKYNAISLYVPNGVYMFDSMVEFFLDKNMFEFSGERGLKIYGDGSAETYFVATKSNNDGILRLGANDNTELWSIEGIGFLSSLKQTDETNNGTALHIYEQLPPGATSFGLHKRTSVLIDDVLIAGYYDNLQDRAFSCGFVDGIHIENKWFITISNVRVNGPKDGSMLSSDSVLKHAIKLHNCYSPKMSKIYMNGYWNYGVLIEGADMTKTVPDYEDFRIVDSYFVGQNYGVKITHSELSTSMLEPGGAISICHINSIKNCITIHRHREVSISNVYFYLPRNLDNSPNPGILSAIALDNSSDIVVSGCHFLEPGFYIDDDNSSACIHGTNRTEAIVSGCLFNTGGVGIYVDENTTGRIVVDSSAWKLGTRAPIWANFKEVVDKSGIVIMRINGNRNDNFYSKSIASTMQNKQELFDYINLDYNERKSFTPQERLVTARNSNNEKFTVSSIKNIVLDNTSGNENSIMQFFIMDNGDATMAFVVKSINGKVSIGIPTSDGEFIVGDQHGKSGSFTTNDGKTVHFTGGIITNIE